MRTYTPSELARRLVADDRLAVVSLQQFAASIGAAPTRDERLQLARIQAQTGLDALAAGDLRAAHAFLADALHHLGQVR